MCLLLPVLAASGRHGGLRTVALHANASGVDVKGANATSVNVQGANATSVNVRDFTSKPQHHTIRICNAYPKAALSVHVVAGGAKKELAKGMSWQECSELYLSFAVGDYFEFDLGGKPVILPSIPVSDTKAMFVAYDKENTLSVWYHYYEKLVNPQVAVIDVAPTGASLKGPAASKLICTGGQCSSGKVEVIPTGEAEPLFPGKYKVTVGQEPTELDLDLAEGECYAVLRTGKDQLMVYPPLSAQPQKFNAQPKATESAAASVSAMWALMVATAALV